MTVPFFSALLFLFYLILLLQTTWVSEIFSPFLKPDLMLVFVVYVGTLPYLFSGAVLVGAGGLLYELFSGSPGGIILMTYFILFFLLKSLTKFILIGEALSFRLLLVFGVLILQDLLIGLLPFVLGVAPTITYPPGTWILAQAAATSLAGWPVWILFKKVESLPRMTPPPKSD
jgi:cell shape-determining protein MreD